MGCGLAINSRLVLVDKQLQGAGGLDTGCNVRKGEKLEDRNQKLGRQTEEHRGQELCSEIMSYVLQSTHKPNSETAAIPAYSHPAPRRLLTS